MHSFYRSRFTKSGGILLLLMVVAGGVLLAQVPVTLAFPQGRSVANEEAAESPPFQVGTNQLVVIAFSDTTGAGPFECPGCDKIYSDADQQANATNPLPPMTFILRNAMTGAELGRQQAEVQPQGRYRAVFEVPADLQDNLTLSLEAPPPGYQLCPNASSARVISPEDFVLGTHEEVYPFWTGCPLPEEAPTEPPEQQQPTPTPTEISPEPTAPALGERSIVVEAFTDVAGPGGLQCPGCDRIFSSSDQVANAVEPLPNMEFVLREADTGRLLARQSTTLDPQGRARTLFRIPAGFDKPVVVELASDPAGFELCPNVGRSRTVQPDDFVLGTHLEQFPFWRGCQIAEPTFEPAPTPEAPQPQPAPPSPMPEQPPAAPGAVTAVVTSRGLNVRTGPGVNYVRLGAVAGGTRITLDGRNANNTWVRGRAETGLEGWFSAGFLRIEGDVNSLPILADGVPAQIEPTATSPPAGVPGITLTAVVTARGLNVRAGPGANFTRLGAVAGGTQLILTGRNADGSWVLGRATEEELTGWFSAAFLKVGGDVLTLPVADGQAAARATPTVTSGVVPEKLPQTGGLDIPLWGLFAMAAAILLALSHLWRWMRESSTR